MNKHFRLLQNSRYVKKKLRGYDVWHPFQLKSVRLGYEPLLKIKGYIYTKRIEREVVEYTYRSIGEVFAEFCSDPEPPHLVETDRHDRCIYLGKKDTSLCYEKGQHVDAMDEDGNWWSAKILDHRRDNGKYLVHFHGWDSKWDKWNNPLEISPFRSIVKEWFSNLKIGDNVEIRMMDRKWYQGIVADKSQDGRVLVEELRTRQSEWIRDSDERIMPINTHIRGIGFVYDPFLRWSDPGGDDVWWIQKGFKIRLSRQIAV